MGFGQIPDALAYDSTIPRRAKDVYHVLIRRGTEPSTCFPSHAYIAGVLGLSPRTIPRLIRGLEAAGWIERVPRRSPEGDPTSNGYWVFSRPSGEGGVRATAARRGTRNGCAEGARNGCAPKESHLKESHLNERNERSLRSRETEPDSQPQGEATMTKHQPQTEALPGMEPPKIERVHHAPRRPPASETRKLAMQIVNEWRASLFQAQARPRQDWRISVDRVEALLTSDDPWPRDKIQEALVGAPLVSDNALSIGLEQAIEQGRWESDEPYTQAYNPEWNIICQNGARSMKAGEVYY
jgi:Helix-turn-helix domain